MAEHGLPALYTVFVWWFATGLILHLDGLRPETFRWSMAGATAVLAAACWGLRASAATLRPPGPTSPSHAACSSGDGWRSAS
jgi:putative photosynthetic complex assembly protein 2